MHRGIHRACKIEADADQTTIELVFSVKIYALSFFCVLIGNGSIMRGRRVPLTKLDNSSGTLLLLYANNPGGSMFGGVILTMGFPTLMMMVRSCFRCTVVDFTHKMHNNRAHHVQVFQEMFVLREPKSQSRAIASGAVCLFIAIFSTVGVSNGGLSPVFSSLVGDINFPVWFAMTLAFTTPFVNLYRVFKKQIKIHNIPKSKQNRGLYFLP